MFSSYTMQRRSWRWLIGLGVTLLLLGLVEVSLPSSWAEVDYQGGYIQTHRYGDPFARPTAPPTLASTPSSFPDNDVYYPSFSHAGRSESARSSPASRASYYFSPASFPWNQAGFVEYDEKLMMPEGTSLSTPLKYSLVATAIAPALAARHPAATRPGAALLIAHLPEHAVLWVEGTRTHLTGRTRYFESPELQPGRKYRYTLRADWIENGQWVSETRKIAIEAGVTQALYLRPVSVSLSETKPAPGVSTIETALQAQQK